MATAAPKRLKCLRCAYAWLPRIKERPVKCPNCQSRHWDAKPAKRRAAGNRQSRAAGA